MEKSAKGKSRLNRFVRIVLWTVAVVVLSFAAARIVVGRVADSRVAHAKESLRAQGYALSFPELLPPPPPADENAAAEFCAAFALLPRPVTPAESLIFSHTGTPLRSLKPQQQLYVMEFLERNKEAFRRIRLARSRPRCRYDRDYSFGFCIPTPETWPSLRMARWLSALAQSEALNGRHEESRECVRDILALSEALRAEPIWESQIIRLMIMQIAIRAAAACAGGTQTQEDLREWLCLLPAPESLSGAVEWGRRGELAAAVQILEDPAVILRGVREQITLGNRLGFDLALGPVIKLESVGELDNFVRLIECCRLPYPESVAAAKRVIPPSIGGRKDDGLNLLAVLRFGNGGMLTQQAVTQASLAMLRAGLEFEAAFLKDGRYPETLTAIDPCTGKPLLYDPKLGRLWSAGPPDATPARLEQDGLVWTLRAR